MSLDCYDPREYDPFLLSITRPLDYYKVRKYTDLDHHHLHLITFGVVGAGLMLIYPQLHMPVLKDPLLKDSRERIREQRAIVSCKTGILKDHHHTHSENPPRHLPFDR